MERRTQTQKARELRALHHDPKLLVLPNIWDPLGARLLESLGYPAVATASAAVAYSLGRDDGERIDFAAMRAVIGRIASSIDLPLTADIERGYAEAPEAVAVNVRRVLEAGAVGISSGPPGRRQTSGDIRALTKGGTAREAVEFRTFMVNMHSNVC